MQIKDSGIFILTEHSLQIEEFSFTLSESDKALTESERETLASVIVLRWVMAKLIIELNAILNEGMENGTQLH